MERHYVIGLFLLLSLVLLRHELVFAAESNEAPQTVRYKLVKMARTFWGLPYQWGGMSERRGVDCSGLVKMLFAKLHIQLPRSSREQIQSGKEISIDQLEMGDLVFFFTQGETPSHVGIYVGNNRFLHAEQKAGRVIITDLNQPWYAKRFLGARRVMDLWRSEEIRREDLTRN
jgi:cell wall-associated NlpC family hydrolase